MFLAQTPITFYDPNRQLLLEPAGPLTAAQQQAIDAAADRGRTILSAFAGRLRGLRSTGYQYNRGSISSAKASADALYAEWLAVYQAIHDGRYQENMRYVPVTFDSNAADAFSYDLNGWLRILSTALQAFDAGASPEEVASLVQTVAEAAKGLGLSGSSLLLIGAGLVLVMLLRK